MGKFNKPNVRPAVTSAVRTETTPSGRTHEGAAGYARDAKSELFLLAVSHMVAEDTFYESAKSRDDRFCRLVHQLAVEDPAWTAEMLQWLRTGANMRSAAIVGAAEYVKGRLDAAGTRPGRVHETKHPQTGAFEGDAFEYHTYSNRRVVDSVLQRPDEPGELLAYWIGKYGRNIPKPVKRGIADAVARLYDERALIKYDSAASGFRFGDVIELTHPTNRTAEQGDLFRHALDRRRRRDDLIPPSLMILGNNAKLMSWPIAERRALFDRDQAAFVLKDAGMTWEQVAGWLQGPMDAKVWEALIPSMGLMALARNLRDFDQVGVSDNVARRSPSAWRTPSRSAGRGCSHSGSSPPTGRRRHCAGRGRWSRRSPTR